MLANALSGPGQLVYCPVIGAPMCNSVNTRPHTQACRIVFKSKLQACKAGQAIHPHENPRGWALDYFFLQWHLMYTCSRLRAPHMYYVLQCGQVHFTGHSCSITVSYLMKGTNLIQHIYIFGFFGVLNIRMGRWAVDDPFSPKIILLLLLDFFLISLLFAPSLFSISSFSNQFNIFVGFAWATHI